MKILLALLLALTIPLTAAQAAPSPQGILQVRIFNPCKVGDVCATTFINDYRSCEVTNMLRNGVRPQGYYGFDIRTTLVFEQGRSTIEVDWVNHTGRMLPLGLTLLAYYSCTD